MQQKKNTEMLKKLLTKSPFVFEFEYGASREGYWVYEPMLLQLEDCADCLKVLYPQHDSLFLLDHSCEHDRQRVDALNIENMNKLYGDNKPKMRDTKITQEQGYLVPYQQKLCPGDVQQMMFLSTDDDPFWMTPVEGEQWRHDAILEGQVVRKKLRKK
jgi:hypothetical protein